MDLAGCGISTRALWVLGRPVTSTEHADPRRARAGLVVALVAGLGSHIPSLRAPPVIDDHFHRAWLDGSAAIPRAPWDLYRWVSSGEVDRLIRAGHIPWWSDPGLRIAVFRPISSLTRWLDHVALADRSVLSHTHSILWWLVLMLLVWVGLRGVVSATARGAAITLVSLSPTLLVPVRWLADRNALISFAFATGGWVVASRQSDDRRAFTVIASLTACAALGGEIAWSLVPVLVALHALRSDDARRSLRFATAAGTGLVAVLGLSRFLGYGIHRSGIYLDPFTQPAEYVRQLPLRLALLTSRLPAAAIDALLPGAGGLREFLALPAFLLAVALPLALLPGTKRRAWLLVAALASLLPVVPAVPSLRLLFGHHLALVMFAVWPTPQPTSALRRGIALGPIAVLLLGATLATARDASQQIHPPAAVTSLAALGVRFSDRVLLVSTSNFEVFQHPDVIRRGFASPAEWLVACSARSPVLLTRSGTRTLALRATTPLLHPADLYRSHHNALRLGERHRIGSVTLTVRAVSEGRPIWLDLDFDDDLERRPWRVVQAQGLHLQTLPLLPVGASMMVSPG